MDGVTAFGEEFIPKVNDAAMRRGTHPRQLVRPFAVHPSVDLGKLAAEHLRTHEVRFGRALGRTFFRLLDVGEGASDLASYLLFDGEFARRLIELGRADAAARRDELADFLFSS
jgi:NTE family protein